MIRHFIKKIDRKIFKGDIKKRYIKLFHKDLAGFQLISPYLSQTDEYYSNPKIKEELENVDPKNVISSARLDIIARYYLFRDISYNRENDAHKSLYCRTIMSRTGANESLDFYSLNEKKGIESHIEAAQKLCSSMRQKGFKKENYVPVTRDFGLFNGAHRLACAMALNERAWVRICGENGVRDFNFSWFCKNGFSLDDKIRLLRGFADIHKQCGIFILYYPSFDQWEYILKMIENEMVIAGWVDLDFTHDYVAFENLIRDIYHVYREDQNHITRKIDLLKLSRLIIRVVLVSDERKQFQQNKNLNISDRTDFYKRITEVKKEIRKLLKYDVQEEGYVTLHSSDSKDEFHDLKQIVLSVNNLRCIKMRPLISVRKEFIDWLNGYRSFALLNNINIDDTCIVGSSPLEVFGIRESTDIDIVVSPELRLRYGDGVTHLTKLLDIGTRNYVRNNKEVFVHDEQLIYDDDYHFMFMGLKFANPELVRYRKASSGREKDIRDVKLLDIFFDYYKYYDDKKVLVKQIEQEVMRRSLNAAKKKKGMCFKIIDKYKISNKKKTRRGD